MAHQVIWTEEVIQEFKAKALLTDEEVSILYMRARNKSIIEQSMALGISPSTVNSITKRLKLKYDEVQPFSDILKPRQFGVNTTFSKASGG